MPTYTLTLPDNYVPTPLPGRDKWIADLRNPPPDVKQGKSYLRQEENGQFLDCCLGRLCFLQGRLKENEIEEWQDYNDCSSVRTLSRYNPVYSLLRGQGDFPQGVRVKNKYETRFYDLASLNDGGYTFSQIADVIEKVWSNAD